MIKFSINTFKEISEMNEFKLYVINEIYPQTFSSPL